MKSLLIKAGLVGVIALLLYPANSAHGQTQDNNTMDHLRTLRTK
ncbi:hypothetical protein [Fictibacillus macauensis]|nr:hypothetical protein [Fictibacillus macauensis]